MEARGLNGNRVPALSCLSFSDAVAFPWGWLKCRVFFSISLRRSSLLQDTDLSEMSEHAVCPSPGVMSQALAKEIPQEEGEGGSRRSSWGLLAAAGLGGTLVALHAVATPFVTPALRKVCLPFVPATAAQIQNVLKMLENRSGSLVDIGSGDGRIVSYGCCLLKKCRSAGAAFSHA